jgi:hypothetical protein
LHHLLHALRLSALGLALAVAGCPGPGAVPFTFEICDNGLDDDSDGRTDCADPLCERTPRCEEDCTNGVDDNEDGAADCDDGSCAWHAHCYEDCFDGVDNEADGLVDCDDPDCDDRSHCREGCQDGTDGDGDGLTDCDDPDCSYMASCQELCDDGVDGDRDGLVDCFDSDCAFSPACFEVCDNGVDDDADGLTDCDDARCATAPACREVCDNGADDDGDGRIDCADSDCAYEPVCETGCRVTWSQLADPRCPDGVCPTACVVKIWEDCDNGADDNGDGAKDCADVGCTWSAACVEDCANGVDDDGDGWVDCEDPQCDAHPACPERCDDGGADADGDRLPDCHESACGGRCPQVTTSYPNDPFYCHGRCEEPSCRLDVACVRDPLIRMGATLRLDQAATVPESTQTCLSDLDSNQNGVRGCGDRACAALLGSTDMCSLCSTAPFNADTAPPPTDPYYGYCQFEDCDNGIDDDGDGAVDGHDPVCPNPPPEDCTANVDLDLDGRYGCEDPSCAAVCPGEICDNGVDDVGNGLIDCASPTCSDFPACREVCSGGRDGDGDGLVDRWDPDCPSPPGAWITRARLVSGRYWVTTKERREVGWWETTRDDYTTEDLAHSQLIRLEDVAGEIEYQRDGVQGACVFRDAAATAGWRGENMGPNTSVWRRATFVALAWTALWTDCPEGVFEAALPTFLKRQSHALLAFEPAPGTVGALTGTFVTGVATPYVIQNYNGDSPGGMYSFTTHRVEQAYYRELEPGDWYYAPGR